MFHVTWNATKSERSETNWLKKQIKKWNGL